MKKNLSVLSLVLIALLMFSACSNAPTTRDATANDIMVYQAVYLGYSMSGSNSTTLINDGTVTMSGDTITFNKDYTCDLTNSYYAETASACGITSLVIKSGTVYSGSSTSSKIEGTHVINGTSYNVSLEMTYNATDNTVTYNFVVDNATITLPSSI